MRRFFDALKTHVKFMIVTIAIFAFGFAGEKYLTTSGGTLDPGGDIYAERLAVIEFNEGINPYTAEQDFFTTSEVAMYQFALQTGEKIEWNRYNFNWDNMDLVNRLKWIYKRVTVERFDPNFYLFKVAIMNEDPKDVPYVNETIKFVADEYVEFARDRLEQSGVGRLKILDSAEMLAEPRMSSRKRLVLKYFIMGAVLGTIVGSILIAARISDDV